MKKAFLGILAAVLVLSMCAMTAFAAGPGNGRCFADADGDGICDNYVPGQCRGTGRGCGAQGGRGGNFVDADGDGVCDYYVSGQGQGGGCGFRGGRGR